jgi:nicotinate-nucleotide adenylyltransferase
MSLQHLDSNDRHVLKATNRVAVIREFRTAITDNHPYRVGVYGGSFNPPHMGHVYMALSLLQTQELDRLWVLPCADHPFKSDQAAFDLRVEMCNLAFSHLEDVEVLSIEEHLPQPNYTVQTLSCIKEMCPKVEFSYIIGGDLVEEIPEWTNAEGLADLAQIIVVPRQGHPVVDAPDILGDYREVNLGFQLPEVSSTRITKMMKRGADVSGFLDRRVHSLIQHHGLYDDTP